MKKFIPIIVLTVISAFLVFYRFIDIPKYLAYDEVEFAKLALSLQNKPYTPYSSLATGHSTLYFYIILTSLKTFGINTFALRLPVAIFGILSVLMFYLVIKGLKNYAVPAGRQELRIKNYNVLPFLLAIIFLTSRWFLNFSRFSFEATFLLFLELTSIYFLIKSELVKKAKIPNLFAPACRQAGFDVFRQKISVSSFYILFSGIFAGLAFLSYTPGRIFFLLPLSFLVFQLVNLLTRKQFNNITIKQLFIFLIPFLIIITPLTSYLLTNKDTRIDQQFFLRNHEITVNEKVSGLWSNISSTTLMLFTKGDMNGRHNYHGKPAQNPILGILFVIGLTISIKNWRNPINSFSIFYFLLSILPALMTYPWENPNMLRTYTAIPSIVYFIGQTIYHLGTIVSRLSFNKKMFVSYFLFLVILFSCLYELRTYFKYQSTVFKQSFEIKLPLEKAIKVKLKP